MYNFVLFNIFASMVAIPSRMRGFFKNVQFSTKEVSVKNFLGMKTNNFNMLAKRVMSQMKVDDPNEALHKIDSGEWIISPNTSSVGVQEIVKIDNEGIGYCLVKASGMSGPAWVRQLNLGTFAIENDVLRAQKNFTRGRREVKYKIAIIPCSFFPYGKRSWHDVTREIKRRGWKYDKSMSWEVAPMLAERLKDVVINEACFSGLLTHEIVVMKTVNDAGDVFVLASKPENDEKYGLQLRKIDRSCCQFGEIAGFACVVPN
jgi:hypothetical protein